MSRTKKSRKKKTSIITDEVFIGIILILCSILGIGKFGIVGRFIAGCSLFLVGEMYIVLFGGLLIYGFYLLLYSLITKNSVSYLTLRTLGFIVFSISVLVLLHRPYSSNSSILKETINTLNNGFKEVIETGVLENWDIYGGGFIGGLFLYIFISLFSYTGMMIVDVFILVVGILFIIGIENISKIKELFIKEEIVYDSDENTSKSKRLLKDEDNKSDEDINKDDIEDIPKDEERPKIKISNFDELSNKAPVKSIVEPKKEVYVSSDGYVLPSVDLLNPPKKRDNSKDEETYERNAKKLENALRDFDINAKVVEIHIGPAVSQYELEIANGTRLNKVLSVRREIELSLAKKDVRIQAPIPGKNTVGIEFANDKPDSVSFYEIITANAMKENFDNKLMVPLGKSINGGIEVCAINKMPHMLIAGTTGSGKSVCVNGIICSILMRARPDEVKFILVDPKIVELSVYNGIPHLLRPVVTNPKEAAKALTKMVEEMEKRYRMFEATLTKSIETYNAKIDEMNSKVVDDSQKTPRMPYIVVIIDELSDLMMVASKEVEDAILRITQKARAAGIHLIVATQRPSTEVITGLIKANIPSRISFAVRSGIDSRTILDQTGAEKLLGKGDMLFLPVGQDSPTRIQGAFITDGEIEKIINYVKEQQNAVYDDTLMNLAENIDASSSDSSDDLSGVDDNDKEIYDQCVKFVVESQKASASLLQRRFKIGYNKAARMIDLLEENQIIGPATGNSKPREVLVQLESNEDNEVSEEEIFEE